MKTLQHTRSLPKLILFQALISLSFNVFAQESLFVDQLTQIPSSFSTWDISEKGEKTVLVGIPFFSAFEMGYINESTVFNDFTYSPNDRVICADVEEFLNTLGPENYLGVRSNYQLMLIGLSTSKNSFVFSVSNKLRSDMDYSRDFLSLLLKGHDDFIGRPTKFRGNRVSFNYYREFKFGYQCKLNNRLVVGANFKLLSGVFNFSAQKIDLDYSVDDNNLNHYFRSDVLINTSTNIVRDESISSKVKKAGIAENLKNPGFATDLFVKYFPNKRVALSVGITNVGFINWKNNAVSYQTKYPDSVYTFNTVNSGDLFRGKISGRPNTYEMIELFSDELDLEKTNVDYKTNLTPEINSAISYKLNKMNMVKLFSGMELKNTLDPYFTIALYQGFGKTLRLTESYSVHNNSFNSFGLGITLNFGQFQFFSVTENISGLIKPQASHCVNFKCGINLFFHSVKKEIEHNTNTININY